MQVRIKSLTEFSANQYGFWENLICPEGENFAETYFAFYRDLVTQPMEGNSIAYSICTVRSRPLLVDVMEIHNHTYEALLPLDGDVLV